MRVFESFGLKFVVLALPINGLLCILQIVFNNASMILLIIALVSLGLALLIFSMETFLDDMFKLGFILTFALGAAALVMAYFLAFKPESSAIAWFRNVYRPGVANLGDDQFVISLELPPHRYQTEDFGSIQISFQNLLKYTLVLKSVMFETRDQFFDGFVVDYESADPPIIDRKEKIGNTTA